MSKLRHRARPVARQRGFSLAEVLIALSLITIISFFVIGAVGPWLGLKQTIDNDRRLQDLRQGMTSFYEENAMDAESQPAGSFFGFQNSTVDAGGNCNLQSAAFRKLKSLVSDGGDAAAKDGFGNAWCVFVSPQLSTVREGATLFYHNIAFVSGGQNGHLDAGTAMDGNGSVTYAGDDVGVVVAGYDIQYPKLRETLRRMSRIANIYEAYFSTRFISYADRDITRDYFSNAYDTSGAIANTNGNWVRASELLGAIGVSPSDAFSAWEVTTAVPDNAITVGNHNETVNGLAVRSPATTGLGTLPYTALLKARIPGPTEAYVSRVAVGNY